MEENKNDLEIVKGVVQRLPATMTDNQMMIEIVKAGIDFQKAPRLFKQAMIECKFRVDPKQLEIDVKAAMNGSSLDANVSTYEDIQAFSEELSANQVANPAEIMRMVKKVYKSSNFTFPKKMKPEPKERDGGFRGATLQWMVNNPTVSTEEFSEWVSNAKEWPTLNTKLRFVKSHIPVLIAMRKLHANLTSK